MENTFNKFVEKIDSIPNDMELGKEIRTIYEENKDSLVEDDKYVRLYAEFENYKRRIYKERDILKDKTILDTINPILELMDDLNIAIKSVTDKSTKEGLSLMITKVENSLHKIGITEVPTDTYNIDSHEVISVIGNGKTVIDVLSKGYYLNNNIIKFPKVVLG